MGNVSETRREIVVNDQIQIRKKAFCIAISIIASFVLLLISISIWISETNRTSTDQIFIQNSTINSNHAPNDDANLKPFHQQISQTQLSSISSNTTSLPEADQSCKCRSPFRRTRNCKLCFFIPESDTVFHSYDSMDKNKAIQDCDKLQGEIPNSEL